MADVRVKRPRIIEYHSEVDKSFGQYLRGNNLNLDHRSYVMHLSQNMVQPVNESFMRLSIPYKRAQSNYGVVILPKSQVITSDCVTDFSKDPMYDVDLGDKTHKLTVSYIDENGEKCQRMESTRYIERYLTFTQGAYHDGRFSGRTVSLTDLVNQFYNTAKDKYANNQNFKDVFGYWQTILQVYDASSSAALGFIYSATPNRRVDPSLIRAGKQYMEPFETADGFDYNSHKQYINNMTSQLKSFLMEDSEAIAKRQFGTINSETGSEGLAINNNLVPIYMNSYLDGLLHNWKLNAYAIACCYYPPDEHADKDAYALGQQCRSSWMSSYSAIHNSWNESLHSSLHQLDCPVADIDFAFGIDGLPF